MAILAVIDQTPLSDGWLWLARTGVPLAAILMPAGFFLSVLGRDPQKPNRLILLLWLGVASLTAGPHHRRGGASHGRARRLTVPGLRAAASVPIGSRRPARLASRHEHPAALLPGHGRRGRRSRRHRVLPLARMASGAGFRGGGDHVLRHPGWRVRAVVDAGTRGGCRNHHHARQRPGIPGGRSRDQPRLARGSG